jgi:hypothetical protein
MDVFNVPNPDPPPSASVAEPVPVASSAPLTVLSDDEIASLVLRDYDPATHKVKTTPPLADAGDPDAYGVRPRTGAVLFTHAEDPAAKGSIHVESHLGDDWANGDLLARVVVGVQPGFCTSREGFLVLLSQHAVVAIAPWVGGCESSSTDRFVTAQGRSLLLEPAQGTGEDGVSEAYDRVWLLTGRTWKEVGHVTRAYEETFEPGPLKGYKRKWEATITGDATGLVSAETWHFTSEATQKTTERTRTRTYTLHGDTLVEPPVPDPRP